MKHIFLVALIIGFGILTRAQTEYEVSTDGTHKILKGIISRDMLTNDTSFSWSLPGKENYTPDAGAVAALQAKSRHLQFIVFGGTWNKETQSLLPRFFSILDAASFPAGNITLIGVDRDYKATGHMAEEMHITRVPAFILLEDGKEIGRVVNPGNPGKWDGEIGKLVGSAR